MAKKVKLVANFEANLTKIHDFLSKDHTLGSFEALLDQLVDVVIPQLEQFPRIGRSFLIGPAGSVETKMRSNALKAKFGATELREYIARDYLILYTIAADSIVLLSIKHHRQLSFDFEEFWSRHHRPK